MTDFPATPYIPGQPIPQYIPLERYLPPLSEGIVSTWLKTRMNIGDWTIDPYGSHPWIPIEAARAGYKVLMTCNNPIIRFITEMLACPPNIEEYQTTIFDLLSSKRGELRLEQSLQTIYQTRCPGCGRIIQVEAYLWRKEEEVPFAKQINCINCGETGEWKIDTDDKDQLEMISKDPIFRYRAVGRVALEGEEISDLIAEAIKVYLPRQLYFLMTLLNKSESLQFEERKKKIINAMLLHLFEKGNILWNWPVSRIRPKSLVSPSQFREINLWHEIITSHKVWTSNNKPLQVTIWPELPYEAGVCIFPGRFKDLPPRIGEIEIKSIISAVPRPNQAFWALSAIWSGWLWGRKSVTPLKSAIERRRYDWKWHTYALHNINFFLRKSLPNQVRFFGIIPELVPRFFSSVLASTNNAGFKIEGISYCDDDDTAQITWLPDTQKEPPKSININNLCKYSLIEILIEANEPLTYNQLHAYFFSQLSSLDYFLECESQELSAQIDLAEDTLQKILGDTSLFMRFGSESQNIDSGSFWPNKRIVLKHSSLSDRVEKATVQLLERVKTISFFSAVTLINDQFPGITTPSLILLKAILESYCKQPTSRGHYVFNENELASQRSQEIQNIQKSLLQIGIKMGFQVKGEQPIHWFDENGQQVYSFYFTAWANISDLLLCPVDSRLALGGTNVLVLPGSRSLLVSLKLKRDGRIAEIDHNWKLLKFRHIRNILELTELTPEIFNDLLDKDPVALDEPAQLKMFYFPNDSPDNLGRW